MDKKTLLIDAAHPEETRIVVLKDSRLDEFEFETSTKKQVKGNVYLAKIVRVEPSLQAAFVDFGENRHGFLPFSEILPDYYRVPVGDRESSIPMEVSTESSEETAEDEFILVRASVEEIGGELPPEHEEDDIPSEETKPTAVEPRTDTPEDTIEEIKRKRSQHYLNYKIQEVIKKRQILLVQVEKEERGTKGAAMTTYLSLAGRYCVLMPNTPDAGGVSRKITNLQDRRRLKKILSELKIPEGMSVIIRTAGMGRTKLEIRKDYEYLLRQWEDIRNKTLESTAPTIVYEEANIIKRAIRDYYSKDVTQILVEGEEGYKTAKEFIRDLTPSHAKKVQQYKEQPAPLFRQYRIEEQMEELYTNKTKLRSGGSIVINQTEALVAIDINSGQSTRERHIEETAFNTNLEAAEEIARQLRLRDLAGLIVIDFIDMDNPQHIVAVEQKLKESLKHDRARIQIGNISAFGLLELSRQRLRPSIFETTMTLCPACQGTGHIRSTQSAALKILRAIEDEAVKGQHPIIHVHVSTAIAFYLLNQKRQILAQIESTNKVRISILADSAFISTDYRFEYPSLTPEQISPQRQTRDQEQQKTQEPTQQHEQRARPARYEDKKRYKTKHKRPSGGRRKEDSQTSTSSKAAQQQSLYEERTVAEGYVELESHRLQKQQQQGKGKKHYRRNPRQQRPGRSKSSPYNKAGLPKDDVEDDFHQELETTTSLTTSGAQPSSKEVLESIQPIIPQPSTHRRRNSTDNRPRRSLTSSDKPKVIPITPLTSIDEMVESAASFLPDIFHDPRENDDNKKPKTKTSINENSTKKKSTHKPTQQKRKGWWQKQ